MSSVDRSWLRSGSAARGLVSRASHRVRRFAARRALPTGGQPVWLTLALHGPLAEIGVARGRELAPDLFEWLRLLERAGDDPRVAGVLIDWRGALGSHAQAETLRRAFDTLRERGKKLAIWADSLAMADFRAASAADRLWMPPLGQLALTGLHTEQLYLKGALDKLEVETEVVHVGRFKSAGERFTQQQMSEAQREQLEAWHGAIFEGWLADVARGRDREAAGLRARVDAGPCSAEQAEEEGWIDGVLYPDEIDAALEAWMPVEGSERREVQRLDAARYHALAVDAPVPRRAPTLVYAVAHGAIRRGSGRGLNDEGLVRLLDELREDASVRGVVLRVDSPGGDALASDLMHRAVARLAEEKAVVVSMGDVAASGGYYLAAPADSIFAEIATLTGSIGVVGGKLNLERLYERLGVSAQSVEQGERAGMFSASRGFSPGERRAVRSQMESIYEVFLDRVSAGRKLAREALEPVAAGRVWSGSDARRVGLVDAIGGPLEALAEVARRAGLGAEERYALVRHPKPSPLDWLRGRLGPFA